MPRLSPFRGVRYCADGSQLAELTAPPYDVISPPERERLARRHLHNAVHIDLPVSTAGTDPYKGAAERLGEWLETDVLRQDSEPVLYGYRMDFTGPGGTHRHTTGVFGALGLSRPEEGEILPHERTTPKAKTDRLELLRATRANLSAIWGLSPSSGLTAAIGEPAQDASSFLDEAGVKHTFWLISEPAATAQISSIVAEHPILIADGHHRFETSLQYRDECRAASGTSDAGGAEETLAYVVELDAEELHVLPIHRLVVSTPAGTSLTQLLEASFELGDPVEVADDSIIDEMTASGFMVLIGAAGARQLRPKRGAQEVELLDTRHLEDELASVEFAYQHGVPECIAAVRDGSCQAAILVRPATVAQIAATADSENRMPPKTTYFHPKPRTGLVLRLLD